MNIEKTKAYTVNFDDGNTLQAALTGDGYVHLTSTSYDDAASVWVLTTEEAEAVLELLSLAVPQMKAEDDE